MKKENKLLLGIATIFTILLILFIINIQTLAAEDEPIPNPLGLNPDNIDQVPQTPEELANLSKNYLKREWGESLRNDNTTLGRFAAPILRTYDKISPYTDPVFRVILGIEPSLSWLFILTLVIWIALVTNLYHILSVFSIFSKTASFIISLMMIIIISLFGWPKLLATKLISLIGTLTSTPMQLLFIMLLIVTLILISMFSKEFEAAMKIWKENRRRNKIEEEIEKLKEQGKSQAEIQKIITDMFGDIDDVF